MLYMKYLYCVNYIKAYCKLDEKQRSVKLKEALMKINMNPVLVEEYFYDIQEIESKKNLKYFKVVMLV